VKTLLINSPYFNDIYRFFPLGIGFIASALKNVGYEYEILDMNGTGIKIPVFRDFWAANKHRFDVVGISSMINNYVRTKEIIHVIRSESKSPPRIVLGGKITAIDDDLLFERLKPDIVVRGDGEEAIVEILKRIEKQDSDLSGIPGISFIRDNNRIINAGSPQPVMDKEKYRIPYEEFDMTHYVSRETVGSLGFIATQMVSSRGCPFKCSYCDHSKDTQSRKMVYHDLKNMETDLTYLKEKYNLELVYFCDDIFTVNKKRMMAVCDLMKKLNIKYTLSTRLDTLDKEKIEKLASTGCYYINLGIETASPKISKLMNKRLDIHKHSKMLKRLQETDIILSCNFIVGYLGEDAQTLKETKDFILEHRLVYNTYFATAYPGTILYDQVSHMIDDKIKYIEKLFDLDMQTQYILNISDLPVDILFKLRKKILVDSIVNIWKDKTIIPAGLLKFVGGIYWNIVQANSSKIAWLKRLTDFLNQAVIKPRLDKAARKDISTSVG
jgi:radical SAM superfamily enzyme YgiQ (UPF0313 family)